MSKPFLRFAKGEDGRNIIYIEGVIDATENEWIYDWYGEPCVTPRSIREAITSLHGDLDIIIDTPGGNCDAGSAIYHALMEYEGHIRATIIGRAYSYGSILATAADEIRIVPTAMIMMHNPYGQISGDYREAQSAYDYLRQAAEAMADIYAAHMGITREAAQEMMDATTYMNAQEAVERGFADNIVEYEGAPKMGVFAKGRGMRQVRALEKTSAIKMVARHMENEEAHSAQATATPTPSPQAGAGAVLHTPNKAREDKNMTWEEAQERFAAQISEAQASATQRGAQEERARLEEIDALGLADADMVREAKYGDKPMTAEQIAVKALKAAAGKPAAVLSARMAEAEVTTDAGAGAVPGTESAKAAAQSENASKLREAYMSVAGLKK